MNHLSMKNIHLEASKSSIHTKEESWKIKKISVGFEDVLYPPD